jgi:hypothetical protein
MEQRQAGRRNPRPISRAIAGDDAYLPSFCRMRAVQKWRVDLAI